MVGEELNTACFLHYLESRGEGGTVLVKPGDSRKHHPVTTGKLKGPRLDRWIRVVRRDGRQIVFQTEIKNWSAHAFDGEVLSSSASPREVTRYKQARWERHWDQRRRVLKHPETQRVLVSMKPPQDVDPETVRPLLIFWEAIGPRDQPGRHLFQIAPAKDSKFSELWVFSVSSYLRGILDANTDESIELEMSAAAARLRILGRLFSAGA